MRAPATWRAPARPRSCVASSTTWASPVAPSGCPRPTRPPLGLTTSPGESTPVAPASVAGPASPGREEAQRLQGVELLGGRGVVQLDEVGVVGPEPEGLPGASAAWLSRSW